MPKIHIIGAGLAGLAASVKLTDAGHAVILHEAAAHAGGRCRSWLDNKLGIHIDNGNHLLLSGNRCAMDYIDRIGTRDSFIRISNARFPFLDIRTGENWVIDISRGRFPAWIFSGKRRVPGTSPWDYLKVLKLMFANRDETLADYFPTDGPLQERFWEPLVLAIVNTPMDQAAAILLTPVLKETFAKGADACRPLIAKNGLSNSLITPALDLLKENGADIRFNHRLTSIEFMKNHATALHFGDENITLNVDDRVIVATPPWMTGDLLPSFTLPNENYPIVNAHFLLDQPPRRGREAPLLGLIGASAHWLFFKGRVVSVTVSAATDMAGIPSDDIAKRLWHDVAIAIGMEKSPMPPVRIIKEKRATFAQTPEAIKLRPDARTKYDNILLAGDWTDTGLPATIEGAIRSGYRAAEIIGTR